MIRSMSFTARFRRFPTTARAMDWLGHQPSLAPVVPTIRGSIFVKSISCAVRSEPGSSSGTLSRPTVSAKTCWPISTRLEFADRCLPWHRGAGSNRRICSIRQKSGSTTSAVPNQRLILRPRPFPYCSLRAGLAVIRAVLVLSRYDRSVQLGNSFVALGSS